MFLKKIWCSATAQFILKTVLYLIIFLGVIYLYSYSGVGQPKFIYNEF
ncbi:teichoic acid D-Ala incorporation-associated protein DltX [Ligilactobacillus acidipiscis]|uniref:Teichoic acid D-Ala incorporation-associated protein DltX n=1 Tax=Ligilactobacillus acidipiscis TaxID=89059 RepID=A0A921K0I5_9LACO|nr:teichoic acid D-Ala incorporation-associated protein DltX [Ligilactobacillus acidipiscis]GEN21773.1 cytochrome c553 [Ligilactobacillus acidipiscis]HJE97028.1 teichoic acid D-Ala incorporation-associated protein DltX [Ligilactobacillus acidipiscis]